MKTPAHSLKDTEVCSRHCPTAKHINQKPKNEIQNEMKNEKKKYKNTKSALEGKNNRYQYDP